MSEEKCQCDVSATLGCLSMLFMLFVTTINTIPTFRHAVRMLLKDGLLNILK